MTGFGGVDPAPGGAPGGGVDQPAAKDVDPDADESHEHDYDDEPRTVPDAEVGEDLAAGPGGDG